MSSCDALQHKYPQATLHRSKSPPTQAAQNAPGGVVWITHVQPEADMTGPTFGESVPVNVQNYHRHNHVQQFSYLRPIPTPGASDSETEGRVQHNGNSGVLQWMERAVMISKSLLRRPLDRADCGRAALRFQPSMRCLTSSLDQKSSTCHTRCCHRFLSQ